LARVSSPFARRVVTENRLSAIDALNISTTLRLRDRR
jgi:hypothetical protein